MKRYGIPLIVIILSSLILYVVRAFLLISSKEILLTLITACLLFVFGVYLNGYKKRKGDTWLRKFIIMALFILTLLIQMSMISVPYVNDFLSIIKATTVIYYMLYVYFGFVFF